jgi:RNA polymerase sigma-70 factor (ECF subfamily)
MLWQNGTVSTHAELTNEFLSRLRRSIRRRVRFDQDAEDITQDVLARFVEGRETIKPESAYAWMFTVARRAIIDHARASRTRKTVPLPEGESLVGDIAADPTAAAELARCMEPMLAALDSDDRTLIQRVDVLGESQADLARESGLSPSGLKSRVQRARQRLLKVLTDCCTVERDRRGSPAQYSPRAGGSCPYDCGSLEMEEDP